MRQLEIDCGSIQFVGRKEMLDELAAFRRNVMFRKYLKINPLSIMLNLHKIGVASSVNMNEQRNRFDTNSIKPGKRFMENL
ncbi:hypothetical protein F8M41_020936 [Gigaspora margarita]|uniref:Uncharacterized protein n=1 Tax=Gigaspora margarita TaxID=4874 RepID=A0A8H4EJB4_GIGMA|nr:hypothetical protein F8M41_020936 [Gigaspora margarita]